MTRVEVRAAIDRATFELDAAKVDLRRKQFEAAKAYAAGFKRPLDTSKARDRVAELEGVLAGLERAMLYAEFHDLGDQGMGVGTSRLNTIEMRDPEIGALLRAEIRQKAADEAKAAAVCGEPRRTDRSA